MCIIMQLDLKHCVEFPRSHIRMDFVEGFFCAAVYRQPYIYNLDGAYSNDA